MSARGASLFARYAYPPNELGYCGPPGAEQLLDATATEELGRRARQFEGAWCYLELLAESCGVTDPLDERLVTAYWVGGPELDEVDPATLVRRLEDRFHGQLGGTWRDADRRARAHHSFHVYEVYPWTRLLAVSGDPTPVTILDRCRVRVGDVLSVDGETVQVRSHPLVLSEQGLWPGGPVVETARWSVDGHSLITRPVVGDRVSLHWDWVCDVIDAAAASELERAEERQLSRIGASL